MFFFFINNLDLAKIRSISWKVFKFVLLIILIFIILYLFSNSFVTVIYCMDNFTEEKLELLKQITKVEDKINYFKEQMKGADIEFKEVLSLKDKTPVEEYMKDYQDAKTALTETRTNLTSEERMLGILKKKLENNDFTQQINTVQKRGFSDN